MKTLQTLLRGLLPAALAGTLPAAALPLEEVLVTAQHRSQTLEEVPFSLTVLDGTQLQRWHAVNMDGLTRLTPSLSGWQQGLSTPIYALRGISTNSFGIGGESSIAVFVDDAYIGRINSTGVRMPDIARVEVLKGPQGTLLGRNASAGAIVYHTRLPDAQPSLALTLAAGNFQTREASLTANTPLLDDRLFLRLTGFYREQDGDVKNLLRDHDVGGEDGHGLRLALAWRAGNWSADLSASNQVLNSGGLGYETLDPGLAALGGVAPDPFDNVLATDIRTFDTIESDDANLRLNWQLGEHWQLRSITAWHRNQSPNLFDVDGSAASIISAGFNGRDSETHSQELRLRGAYAQLDWVAGLSYFAEQIDTRIDLELPLFGETAFHRGDYRSLGLYGDVSWASTDRLTISAGLRYSYDDKDFAYRTRPGAGETVLPSLLGYRTDGRVDLSNDWDAWQPRLAANWLWRPGQTLYLGYARGYKAGGFEPAAQPALSVFDPETVDSIDLGWRGSVLDGRLGYNLSAYYYDNRDYQVQVIANGIARTINSSGVTGSGFEWDLNSQLGERWQLRLHGAYTDANFDELVTDEGDFTGNRTILTPRHSAALSLDYHSATSSWGSVALGWQSEYQGDIYYTIQNTDDASRDELLLHHLRLAYHSANEHWRLTLRALNLLDEDYTVFQQDVGAGPVARRGMPRQVLLEASVSY